MARKTSASLVSPVRFVLGHAALGVLAGVLFVAALLLTDTAGLGRLALASEVGWLAVAVMTAFFAITFGSVQVAIGLYLSLAHTDGDGRSASRPATGAPQPALVLAGRHERRG